MAPAATFRGRHKDDCRINFGVLIGMSNSSSLQKVEDRLTIDEIELISSGNTSEEMIHAQSRAHVVDKNSPAALRLADKNQVSDMEDGPKKRGASRILSSFGST